MNVVIIGTMAQEYKMKEIERFVKTIDPSATVWCPKPITKGETRENKIAECFSAIEKATVVVALRKDERMIDDGLMYELEYARRCGVSKIFIL